MSNWTERPVSRDLPHFVLSHDNHASPVALVGPAIDGRLTVEFLVPRDSDDELVRSVAREILREIDFYLDGVGGPDPWAYAIYHCTTVSNAYSDVHWSYFEPSG